MEKTKKRKPNPKGEKMIKKENNSFKKRTEKISENKSK